jgi:hypothetical protein
MTHEINVPEMLGDKSLQKFFKGWFWDDDPASPVKINIYKGTHLAPWATTLFGAYALWLKEVRKKEVTLDYERDTYLGRFLERMGLPQLLGEKLDYVDDISQRICPLTRISNSSEIAPFVRTVMELLDIDDIEIADAIKYSLVELLRNVVQHSRSSIGAIVSAVYFPNTGLVDVTVADIGCGIRAALRQSYREINSDQKAVRFALLPHVSGTFSGGAYHSMMNNAGLVQRHS